MAVQRRALGSTDQLGQGDNMFSPQRMASMGQQPPGGTAQGTPEAGPMGMPGTPQNPNTGVAGGQPPVAPTPPIVNPPLVDQNPQGAPPAFDPHQQVGHNGSINGMNREQYRDAFMGSGVDSLDKLNQFLAKNGGSLQGANGVVQTPFGEQIDMLANAKGAAAGHGAASASWGGVGGPSGPVQQFGGEALQGGPMNLQSIAGTPGNPSGPSGPAQPTPVAVGPRPIDGPGSDFGPQGPGQGPNGSSGHGGLDDILNGLLSGNVNKDVLNRRVSSANDSLNAKRRSMLDNQRAELADRGLSGDGAETSALGRLDENLGNEFSGALTDIYSDESKQADSRMMQALTTKAGLSIADAQNLVDRFNAQTGRQNADTGRQNADTGRFSAESNDRLGQGNLALGNKTADQNFSLGQSGQAIQKLLGLGQLDLGRGQLNATNRGLGIQETGQQLDNNHFLADFGLRRDKQGYDQANDPTSGILALIQQYFGGAGQTQGGHI